MAKQINVNVQERKPGRKYVKLTRAQKLVPVVIYGKGKDNQFGAIEELSFRRDVIAHENSLFSLSFKGKSVSAVVRNLDIDNLNRTIIHADFYEVNMNEKIDASVSIHFVGEAKGISEGGVLNKVLEEIQIFCLPSDIPNDIEVDVSALDIDDRILISDLNLPSNIEVLHDLDQAIVSVGVKVEEPEEEVVEPVEVSAEAEAGKTGEVEHAKNADSDKGKKEEKAS